MKIIIPTETKSLEAPVCPSFGRAPLFLLYDIQTGEASYLENQAAQSQGGAGILAAQAIVDSGASAIVTFRCGQNAADVLKAADIILYQAEGGSLSDNIARFKEKKLAELSHIHAGFHHHGGANA